ncbi:LacI family DNA-binding transcriptional regulator [Microbacterium sp. Marseille-Q6648]|uniref:LacI family DNA-binding transcriptional regulator n=1 Tax=Microbacterium sp. Marseille-Q6648 TaxID=2937991 RepID=UPI00203B5957|nr:LacI family DNA-binding transcriptional regulator [Microbacterium sp. Marseille-Q6648]
MLNDDPRVGAELRERVTQAALSLRYTANLTALAMKSGTTQVIAVIANDIRDPYFAAITRGVMDAAEETGLTVTLASSLIAGDDLAVLREVKTLRPRLIVLSATSFHAEPTRSAAIRILQQGGGAVVVVGSESMPFPTVRLFERAAAGELAEALVRQGYRQPAVIAGPRGHVGGDARLDGFHQGMWKAGVAVADARVFRGDYSRDGGFAAARRLLVGGLRDVDLIWAANDRMAIGAMAAIREAGLTPGVDVGIAGFDDIDAALDMSPTLTTVHLALHEAGYAAVRIAAGHDLAGAHIPAPEVRLRGTTPRRA